MNPGKMSKRKALVCAVSSVLYDQRVQRMGGLLTRMGYEVTLYGRKFRLREAPPSHVEGMALRLVRHVFNREAVFYAEYNLRLFFHLLIRSDYAVVVSNDLDTLPACYLAWRWRRFKLIFDSHELFSEAAELSDNRLARRVWRALERWLLPRVPVGLTVSESIRAEYRRRYGVDFHVLRNIPPRLDLSSLPLPTLNLDPSVHYLILQGTGINRDRGAEEAVEALVHLPENFHLIVAGDGDVMEALIQRVRSRHLGQRVHFTGRLPYRQLMALTTRCWAGLSLDKPTCLNYLYSLPNKIFDYIQARIPVVVSPIPEPAKIVLEHGVGVVARAVTPEAVAEAVMALEKALARDAVGWKQRLDAAARALCRENEEASLLNFLRDYLG